MSKKYKLLTALMLAFSLVGCARSNVAMQSFKYHENAKRKPVVAMLPVVCRVDNYLPWDLSEEFTSEIQRRLINHSVVYLNSVDMPENLRKKLEHQDSIRLDKNDFKELSAQNDFVVLLELIDHSEEPYQEAQIALEQMSNTVDRVLNMKMRVKVTDLRSETPKTVLQEILHVNHLIPRDALGINYDRVVWGSDSYPATAYGRAHAKLERDLSKQIENYISIAH